MKIHILSPEEAHKIAAGEVIERPAHIIKELMENALDAKAAHIKIYVEKAGKKLIRIIDDGCGMSSQDAHRSVLPHATSKITSLHDVTYATTFGFRGEALTSIAAVSTLTIKTKEQEEGSLGTQLIFSQGRCISEETCAIPSGTDITVEDLFSHIPARKKFLKEDDTEWNALVSLIHAFCLSHQHIHVTLYHNNRLILNAPAIKNLKDRALQLWDQNMASNLLLIDEHSGTHGPIKITGYISNHHFWRYGRTFIFLFVNNRLVKQPELTKALLKGYHNTLPQDRFPAACLSITIDPTSIDVNVHPKKEEVRFEKPGIVAKAIQTCVEQTLEMSINQHLGEIGGANPSIPQGERLNSAGVENSLKIAHLHADASVSQHVGHNFNHLDSSFQAAHPDGSTSSPCSPSTRHKIEPMHPEPVEGSKDLSGLQHKQPPFPGTIKHFNFDALPFEITKTNPKSEQLSTTPATNTSFTFIGQLFNTYLLIEQEGNLIMIDQHAAHERILYETFLTTFEQQEGTQLLFSTIISLTPHELMIVLAYKDFFGGFGIDFAQFSPSQISISSCPPLLTHCDFEELFKSAVAFVQEHEHLDKETVRKQLHEHVHSHMACKAAIKAGDVLDQTKALHLIRTLLSTNKRFMCVHGRPTMWVITKHEIEKKFHRK